MNTSKMKSYRMSGISLARLNLIREWMNEMYQTETTETEAIKIAIQELYQITKNEYRNWKESQ